MARPVIVHPSQLGPNALVELGKQGVKVRGSVRRGDPEHEAQTLLFQDRIPKLATWFVEVYGPNGPCLDWRRKLDAIYAIPNFNAMTKGPKAKIIAKRFKDEGQKPGSPDIHLPFGYHGGHGHYSGGHGPFSSCYIELKYEGYPSAEQKERMRNLSFIGNACLVVRVKDVEKLADAAVAVIRDYLRSFDTFIDHAHPKHRYLYGEPYGTE